MIERYRGQGRFADPRACGCHPLELAQHGAGLWPVGVERAAHLACLWPAAASRRDVESRPIRCSSRKCAMSSAFMSRRRSARSCSASMRKSRDPGARSQHGIRRRAWGGYPTVTWEPATRGHQPFISTGRPVRSKSGWTAALQGRAAAFLQAVVQPPDRVQRSAAERVRADRSVEPNQ